MEDKLVAVNYLADDPISSNLVEQAKKIQHKIKNPSAEEVLALKPDVVFAYDWSDMNRVENLRNLGMDRRLLRISGKTCALSPKPCTPTVREKSWLS